VLLPLVMVVLMIAQVVALHHVLHCGWWVVLCAWV